MTTYMFKSFPANRSCNINLAEIEKQYHIFTTAVDKCNAGITFRKERNACAYIGNGAFLACKNYVCFQQRAAQTEYGAQKREKYRKNY